MESNGVGVVMPIFTVSKNKNMGRGKKYWGN
jgi:hypothetical protein